MRIKLLGALLLSLNLNGFSQNVTKIFDEVKTVKLTSSGVIKKNNVIKGYYNFFEFDKIDRKTRSYKLNLLDENLNTTGTKEIAGPKSWDLTSSAFDGNNFCFKFYNEKTDSYDLKVYNQNAEELSSASSDISEKRSSLKYQSFYQAVNSELNVIPNTGFIDYTYSPSSESFMSTYISDNSNKTWSFSYDNPGKSFVTVPTFLNGDNQIILTSVNRVLKSGLYSMTTYNSIIANETKTGNKLFELETEFENGNYVVPINAIFLENKILVVGLNYKDSKTKSSTPDGLAFLEIDRTGKILKTNFKTFEESLSKFLPLEGGKLNGGYYLFIHDIVRTKNNTTIMVAEKFKKPEGSGALTALATVSGSGGIRLQLENMVVLEFDKDGNAIQAQEIEKAKGKTGIFPSYTGFLSSYFLAYTAKLGGEMDYMFTLKNEDNTEFTFSFVDYERLETNAKKTKNYGQIKYKGGKFTIDKIAIKNEKATKSWILQAKSNHIIQVNYFEKEKKLSMDMIKLNN